MRLLFAWALAGLTLVAARASADEIIFKNGDRITGKIISASDGKMVVQPDFARSTQIALPQNEIATFTTTDPLFVELSSGNVLNQARAASAGEARVVLLDEGQEREIAVTDIRRINPEAVKWRGSVSVNGLYGRSTTTAASIGISADASRRDEKDRVNLSVAYSYGVQKIGGITETNINNWMLQGKYDHFFSPSWYVYFGGAATGDDVNRLDLRTTPSAGTGRQWIDRGVFHFSTEAGAAYLYEDYRFQRRPTQDISVRLAYHVDHAIDGERIKLAHNVEYLQSLKDTGKYLATADAGVRFAVTSRMFSEIKGKVIYDSRPGFTSRNTTTELRLGVGLNY